MHFRHSQHVYSTGATHTNNATCASASLEIPARFPLPPPPVTQRWREKSLRTAPQRPFPAVRSRGGGGGGGGAQGGGGGGGGGVTKGGGVEWSGALLLDGPGTFPIRYSHCNLLQHTATHCNILQHTKHTCSTAARWARHFRYRTLQHAATRCNTLQHTATQALSPFGINTHARTHAHARVFMYLCIFCLCVCMCTCMHVCMYVYMYACVYV